MAQAIADLLSTFTFKEATHHERTEAIALFRQVYRRDIGHVPEDAFDPVAHHLIAKTAADEVVASFRLLGPQQRPFDIERFCDLSPHLSPEATPALLGRLSVRHDMRSMHHAVVLQLGMLKLAILFAQTRAISDLFLYAMPHLITFYRGAFFRPLDCNFFYAPLYTSMRIMQLDLRDLERRQLESKSPRLYFLLHAQPSNFHV